MKPTEFIDFAGNLAMQASTSAPKSRTVVSRAYYGAFHLAREFLVRMGKMPTDRHDAHEWLQQLSPEPARQAGFKLADLCSARKRADYRLADSRAERPDIARQYLVMAREIEVFLQQREAEPRTSIIAAEVQQRQRGLFGS